MGYLARTLRRLTRLRIAVVLSHDGRRWDCLVGNTHAWSTTPTKALQQAMLVFNHQDQYLDAAEGGPDGSHDVA